MGQILRPENITQITSVSPTQLKLPSGAFINIGGQQYYTPSDNNPGTLRASTMVNDGTNGDPRISVETRIKNAYVEFIIKF